MTTATGWVGIDHLLTSDEAAAVLRVSTYTVRRFRREGRLPAVAIGGVWRYDPADIRAYINQHRSENA